MQIKIPPKGQILLDSYKRFSGDTRASILVRFLEEGMKRDKTFQNWLAGKMEYSANNEPEPLPKQKSEPPATPVIHIAEDDELR